jgi:hypothetical protein
MKKIVFIVTLLICGVLFAEHNFSVTATENSAAAVPAGNALATPAEVGTEVEQGDLVSFVNRVYMAVEAGTVTNIPTHTSGEVGTPSLRWYPSLRSNSGYVTEKRVVVYLSNLGTNRVWVSVGDGDAEADKGIFIDEGDRVWFGTHRAMSVITESGSANIAVQEIY